MNLAEMLIECSINIDEQDNLTTETIAKLKTGLNYAYQKIAREKFMLDTKEEVVLDANKEFSLSSLTKEFLQIIGVFDENCLLNSILSNGKIKVPSKQEGDSVTVVYYYLPDKLVDNEDIPEFPEGAVDPKIMCFYASYYYFSIDDDPKMDIWLSMFNDGFRGIRQNRGEIEQVITIYSI